MYYLCKKTMYMNYGKVAFEKGMVYKCTRKGNKDVDWIFQSESSKSHFMPMDYKKKHLVKIKDSAVIAYLFSKEGVTI